MSPWQVRSRLLTCNSLPLASVGGAPYSLDEPGVVNCVLKAGCAIGPRLHISDKMSPMSPPETAASSGVSKETFRPLITETCDTLAQPALAFAPTIPTRIAFWVMVINSTKLMTGHYSTMTGRAIRVLFTQRFTAVDAEPRPGLRRCRCERSVGLATRAHFPERPPHDGDMNSSPDMPPRSKP
jgi:hypothetical protein